MPEANTGTSSVPCSCRSAVAAGLRPVRSVEAARDATERLLMSLAEGHDQRQVRSALWAMAEGVRVAERRGSIARPEALACYDLLGSAWSLCDQLARAWSLLERAEAARAMDTVSRAGPHIDDLMLVLPGSAGLLERIRARVRGLWHLAEALDEASFLADSGDWAGAKDRAEQLLDQGASLQRQGNLSEDEALLVEDQAARFGARPRAERFESWAS
jgi:hypothetical protein